MKIFRLDKKAYHSLENRFSICISESGHIVQTSDSRVRYHIKLDEKSDLWVYCRFTRKRDECRDFIKEKKVFQMPGLCGF